MFALHWLSVWLMLQPIQRHICFATYVCFYKVFWVPLVWKKILLPAWLFSKTYRRKKCLLESKCEFPYTAIKILILFI